MKEGTNMTDLQKLFIKIYVEVFESTVEWATIALEDYNFHEESDVHAAIKQYKILNGID